jgi:hypothetical protein
MTRQPKYVLDQAVTPRQRRPPGQPPRT